MKKSVLFALFMTILGATALTPVQAQDDLVYVAVNPCRIVDTREAGGAITANNFRNFRVSGTVGELAVQGGKTDCLDPKAGTGQKPLAIVAYVLAVKTSNSGPGVLTAYPSDQLPPPVGTGSTVNFSAQQNIGNTTNITLCDPAGSCPSSGEFAVLARSTNQHVVVDVQGYFYPAIVGVCPVSAPTRFIDNGDQTICDTQTGLMWEKKVTGEDFYADFDNPHDVDNYYSLSISGIPPDGTAYTDFLARLNNTVMGVLTQGGIDNLPFAGHTDWRLPTIAELQTIQDCSSGSPCIDPIFGPTREGWYWSSTTFAAGGSGTVLSGGAWGVIFADAFNPVLSGSKLYEYYVRAVRGGR